MVRIHSGSFVLLMSVIEQTRTRVKSEDWQGGSWGMASSVLGSVVGDCGVIISLVDPTVVIYNTKNLLVEQDVGFTVDLPKNPLPPSLTPWPVSFIGHIPHIQLHAMSSALHYSVEP